jgi:hypothetical protein
MAEDGLQCLVISILLSVLSSPLYVILSLSPKIDIRHSYARGVHLTN